MSRGQGQVHVGSGVNKSPAGHLFGRQKTLRKQTESLQRGERGMCAMNRPERVQQGLSTESLLLNDLVGAHQRREQAATAGS